MNDVYMLKEYYIALDKLLVTVDNRLLDLEGNEKGDSAEAIALKVLFKQLENLRYE